MTKLSREACLAAIRDGDFKEAPKAAPAVALILTQSWCPQWGWMRSYLGAMPESEECAIFWVEYDNEVFFEEFMTFKEDVFGNREVPYVRYYREGRLVGESNFIDQKGFKRLLGVS
jgi:hypothetical protein